MEKISRDYETVKIWKGITGYHGHRGDYLNRPIRPYKGHRIGLEIECEFLQLSNRTNWINTKSNLWYNEIDGSIDRTMGVEVITIPLLPEHAKSPDWLKDNLTERLDGFANAWDTNGRCGLHIHIGREILGKTSDQRDDTLGKLLFLYHHHIEPTGFNATIFGRSQSYHANDGKTRVGDAATLLGQDVLKQKTVSERVKNSMIAQSSTTRYFDINITNEHTIEFRKGRGTVNPNRIAMFVEYVDLMCNYARLTPWNQIGFNDFVVYLSGAARNDMLRRKLPIL